MKNNLRLIVVILRALHKVREIIREFKPELAIGVGGFANSPALWAAARQGIPTMLQEQNGYSGVTNRILAWKAKTICVSYDGLERFFPAKKIVKTGNPIRKEILNLVRKKPEAYQFFHLSPEKQTVLVFGGSQGARTLNRAMAANLDIFRKGDLQLFWQTGELYYEKNHKNRIAKAGGQEHLYCAVHQEH